MVDGSLFFRLFALVSSDPILTVTLTHTLPHTPPPRPRDAQSRESERRLWHCFRAKRVFGLLGRDYREVRFPSAANLQRRFVTVTITTPFDEVVKLTTQMRWLDNDK